MAEPTQTHHRSRTSVFERLARWSYRLRWWALVAWVIVLAGVTVGSQAVGSDYYNDLALPGSESQEALDTLQAAAPMQANDTIQIVMHDPAGIETPTTQAGVQEMLAEVRTLAHVADVRSPYDQERTISSDGTIGYATVVLDGRAQDVPNHDIRQVIEVAQAAAGDGLQVELGGNAVRSAEENEGPRAELVGLLGALVILVVMFGSLLAASIPIVIAIFAVGSTLGLIVLASHLASVADFTPPIATLVGLGVGVDYALLIFARYRGELISGASRERAARTALDTAGRTIFFAGCTVIIALLGLVLLGLGVLRGLAVALALTVLMTMIASLTLLPALLAIIGGRVERRVRRRAERRPSRVGSGGSRWGRWAAFIQRRPWLAVLLPTAALLALATPALDMRLGFADAGNDDPSSTSRQAYDLLTEGFGPGFTGPLVVVVDGGDEPAFNALQRTLAGTPNVAAAVPAGPPHGGVATMIVIPESTPQAAETTELMTRLREEVLPPLASETGARYLVGGGTAGAADFADAIADRLPVFIAVVVALAALLLMAVFRSLLIPLKAAVLNLLSIGASLGVITLVFQEGFLGEVIGVEPGPVEASIPVMTFAIVFGLSMDYEIFLLSRMHEEWDRRRDATEAIREGVAKAGRVVFAAAAIMIVVFGAFTISPERLLKEIGLGLGVAILLDAMVVRFMIVPGVMQLFGRRAWWLPGWIGRLLPRVALERAERVSEPIGQVTGTR